jgi:hypothetical protein
MSSVSGAGITFHRPSITRSARSVLDKVFSACPDPEVAVIPVNPYSFRFEAVVLMVLLGTAIAGTHRANAQLPAELSESAYAELWTMAPGTAIHALFGHSALRVVDPAIGLDAVFNYGTFDPTDPWFLPKFVYGDLDYYLSVAGGRFVLQAYAAEQRSVFAQRLALAPSQLRGLYQALRLNLEPENRFYPYDFVRDNCSTRLYDLLHEHAGLTAEAGESPSYRALIRSYLHPVPWLDLGIHLVLGRPMQQVPTPAEATFLPYELMDALDAAEPPLVATTDTLLWIPATPSAGASARPWTLHAFRLAPLLLLILAFYPGAGQTRRFRRVDRSLMVLSGLVGLFLLWMWLGTLHTVTAWNSNLLWLMPLNIWFGVRVGRAGTDTPWVAGRTTRILRGAALGMATLALLTPLLPMQSIPAAAWPWALLLALLHLAAVVQHRPVEHAGELDN